MGWVCVYEGSGPTDAYILEHWLKEHEVGVVVRGEHRMGIQGAVPVAESWPTLWVQSEHAEQAKELVASFERPREVRPTWICPACGEVVEPTFASCWSCGTDRPGLPEQP